MAKAKTSNTRPSGSARTPKGSVAKSGREATISRNVSGYQKRQERKDKARQTGDLYEYTANKNKRAHIALDVDTEELAGQRPSKNGLDDDEELDSDMEALRRKISANMDGDIGVVESEDDEEIDSDGAFEGESDEERFGAFTFAEKRKSTKAPEKSSRQSKKARFSDAPAEIDLNEDEPVAGQGDSEGDSEDDEGSSEEEDGDEDEEGGVSLSAMLDGSGSGDDDADSASESESENEDEDDALMLSDEEAAPQDSDALDKLDRFIDELNPAPKRKASELGTDAEATRKRKRRALVERKEAGLESEFATRGGPAGKLSLDDLLKPLAASKSGATLEKTARMLASSKVEPLAAPLHTRAQERLDRQAAYETTKEEVEKWAPTMKRIKEAEHLSFPLQKAPVIAPSASALTSKFKPTTELESAVDRLLKSAKLRESDIEKTEELEMAHLTMEEVAARRAELRHMRELMFRADAKAKRVAKIKSKTYRKIQKKAKAKDALSLEEIEALDPEAAAAERLKLEVSRAKERATMRHKNTGKWAKQMMSRGQDMDVDQRRELNAQLERGEQLRRKIQGLDSDGEPQESDSDPDEDVEAVASHAFDELKGIDFTEASGSSGSKKKSGLLNMKFMLDAADRDNRDADAMADDFRAELVGLTAEGEDVESPVDDAPTDTLMVQGNQGRMIYRPSATQAKAGPSNLTGLTHKSTESDASSVTLKSSVEPSGDSPTLKPSLSDKPSSYAPPPLDNPWLTVGGTGTKLSRRKNEALVSKDSAAVAKSQATLKKRLALSEDALAREADDAIVEISLDDAVSISAKQMPAPSSSATTSKKVQKSASKASAVVDSALRDSDDEGDDVEIGERGDTSFKQKELVALAFAGDNVVEEFNSRKQREIEAAAPKEIDTTLAGWGAWGGRGVKKSNAPPKPYLIKKIAGVAPSARADAGKAHLIISERKDKKASKYLVKDLPHPYTSRAQFERSLEQPVGAEWNTRTAFQKGTLPAVVKKMGTIIEPVQRKF